jgi:hypothetical protein
MGNSIRITNRYVYNQAAEGLRSYKEGHDLGNVVTTVGTGCHYLTNQEE